MSEAMYTEPTELNPATASVLRRFAARRTRLIWIRALAVGLLTLAATMSIVMLVDYRWLLPTSQRLVLTLTGYGLTVAAMWWVSLRFLKRNNQQEIAKQLESVDPRLREDLLSAVELSSEEGANGSVEFRERLQRVVARRAAGMDVEKLLPLNLLRSWITAAAIVAGLILVLMLIPPLQIGRRVARAMLPGLAIQRASMTRIEILRPDPATAFVANGDAVGITAEISNLTQLGWSRWGTEDGVWLQYRSGDSPISKIEMATRISDASRPKRAGKRVEFSANLMMGQSPVRYRVIAGDAVTLWNTLTPRSRPHVQSFRKTYVYPAYANLPDESVDEDHGDLRAIAGTRATVTVEFDEPVSEAVLRIDNLRRSIDLVSVEGSTTLFKTTIAMESPTQYQVDAVSRRSGLSNPFGRQYSIVPLVDSPPIVRWDKSIPKTAVVSPIEIVSLAAEVVDDLPIDRVMQKTVVNGKPLDAVAIKLNTEGRRHDLSLAWDLMSLSKTLSVGDIVQTRFVAIDRRGQMTDSEILEFVIAEKGFDSHRHDFIDRFHRLTSAIHVWFDQAKLATDSFDAEGRSWESLPNDTDDLISEIETELAIPSTIVAMDKPLELVGKSIVDWRWRISMLRKVSNDPGQVDSKLDGMCRQLDLIDNEARSLFSFALTVALVDDAISIQKTLAPLLGPNESIPQSRVPRYLNMLTARLIAMGKLIDSHASQLQESPLARFKEWINWTERWAAELRELSEKQIKDDDDRDTLMERLRLFDVELKKQTRHSILDGSLVSSLPRSARKLDHATASVADAIDIVANLDPDTDLESKALSVLLDKIEGEVSLHQQLPDVDLRYVADMNLTKSAMAEVGKDGVDKVDGEPAQQVQQKIASAIGMLTAAHRIESCRREMGWLASAERSLSDTASSRIDHPTRLERFSIRMEHTIELLKELEVNWRLVQPIVQTKSGSVYSEARQRIVTRRWIDDEMLSAARPLSEIRDRLGQHLVSLKPLIDDARDVLMQYAPTIAELARTAAEDVEREKETTRSDDVVEALNDFSNTADLMDPEQRELARDADGAAGQIQAAKSQLEKAAGDDVPAAMQDLAEVLRTTAEHFDNAKNGNDLAQSRKELRSGEQEMNMGEDLDRLVKRAEAIADAAAKSPQELLQQLERQLERNEGMQDELQDIADQSEDAVQRELEKLAEDENNINQSLEASDPEIRERKRRISNDLKAADIRLKTIEEALLDGAQRSSNWGNLDETRDDLDKARRALNETAKLLKASNGEKEPMQKIRDTAMLAADAVAKVGDAMDAVAENAERASEQNLHQNEMARKQQQKSLQRFERDARRRQIKGQRAWESLWKGESNAAKQRFNTNKRARSEAEQKLDRLDVKRCSR